MKWKDHVFIYIFFHPIPGVDLGYYVSAVYVVIGSDSNDYN